MNLSELLAKYDVAGPRYTSYPTVPYWTRAPEPQEWLGHVERAIARGKEAGEGASLYIHIPYCRSLCHYCGCNTFITRDEKVSGPYVDSILKEWSLYTARLGRFRVDELHLGGGTPTFLPANLLAKMVGGVLGKVDVSANAELSVEADPRVTTKEQLKALREQGFRRLSLGIQDFDETVQHSVNRHQTVDEVRAVTEAARELGYTSVNYDLIYGLPKQTADSVKKTIEIVRGLKPDRIAFYGYAHIPWMKSAHRKFQDSDVPGGPEKRKLYEIGCELLAEAGYLEIGMDHFALPGDKLWAAVEQKKLHRNFQGYTERRTMPLLGLGVSSIGDTWTAFAQNEKTVPEWQAKVEAGQLPIARGHLLDEEDLTLRRHILEVMTRFETDWSADQNIPYLKEVPERLAELASDGLVEVEPTRLKVTEPGKAFVRVVAMALDARLARQAPDKPLFSRTV